ncbi:MAG: beta-ketoacyl-ACP synthase II [Lentisphaerae bacterium]|nr:beta-ketoacyl-ACP synthase II [Lentisphaerota bacterium]
MRRVVITGIGVVTPLGSALPTFWENIRAGRNGIGPIESFDASGMASRIAGEVQGFDVNAFITPKDQRRMDRFTHYALGAVDMALDDSGLDLEKEDRDRIGVLVGSGIGGLRTLEIQHGILRDRGPGRCSPFMIPQMISNIAGGLAAIRHGLRGPNFAVVSACASAAHSLGGALRIIERGDADVMVSGGAEASVTELGVAGFCAMRALSTRNDEPETASRPFDRDRDGFVIADGAGVMILEEAEHARARGARVYAELAGFGMTCDAYHMTAPAEDGRGAARAMRLAMADAGLTAGDIDYINAHGTSTPLNDKVETLAIKLALGEERAREIPVSSSKSMTGHLLGAAAGVETAICALSLHEGVVPPTINLHTPDPACDLDYVSEGLRELPVRACLNNSLGFGGHNACLCLKRAE